MGWLDRRIRDPCPFTPRPGFLVLVMFDFFFFLFSFFGLSNDFVPYAAKRVVIFDLVPLWIDPSIFLLPRMPRSSRSKHSAKRTIVPDRLLVPGHDYLRTIECSLNGADEE